MHSSVRMLTSSVLQNGFSPYRSSPNSSETGRGGIEGKYGPGDPLKLTIRSPSFLKLGPEAAHYVDPNPDWSLEDLQKELDVIASRFTAAPSLSLDNHPCPPNARGVSWRELSVTADFGRTSGAAFRMRAFDSDSDETNSSDEDEDEADSSQAITLANVSNGIGNEKETSTLNGKIGTVAVVKEEEVWASKQLLTRTEYVESALLELERERCSRVQVEFRKRQANLDNALREEAQREAALLARVEREKEAKRDLARRTDKQDQRYIAEKRDQQLSDLQRDHELRSQFEARQIRKEAEEEEIRRQNLAALEEREKLIKARYEAEAKKKADAEREKAEAEDAKRKAQAAALQRAEAEQKAKEDLLKKNASDKLANSQQQSTSTASGEWKLRVAPAAAKLEEARLQKLREFQDACARLQVNSANQKDYKALERLVIKHLQQIAATNEQVKRKSMDLFQLLSDTRVPSQFLTVKLGEKLLSQCESQVLKLPSFAFALAQVFVNVATQVPNVMDVVLAKLHEVCIYTVPKYYVFPKDQHVSSDLPYYKALGYKEQDGKLESTDDYVTRMSAYMRFYGAIVQTNAAGGINPHGIAAGWAWCARLLNNIPANRGSASALEAFLAVAGYRLYQVYPRPFMKVMQTIVSEYIQNLKTSGDIDTRAVVSRLETYLHHQKYLIEPEGRKMPERDISSSLKA